MPTRLISRLSSLAASLALLGCSFVPPLVLPGFDTSGNYREASAPLQAPLPWKPAASQALAGDPWQIFDLPELPGLLVRLEEANADLALARARYDQAAALIGQARAGLFPAVSAAAAVTRARASGGGGSTTTDSLAVAGSWEIDLWGRVHACVEASEASARASAADLAGVRLSLQAQLAQALLSLRVVDAQRQLLEATVADYRRYVQLTGDRVRFGVASRADLALAETQLHSAEAQTIETDLQRARLERAIAVLVGETPAKPAVVAGRGRQLARTAEPPRSRRPGAGGASRSCRHPCGHPGSRAGGARCSAQRTVDTARTAARHRRRRATRGRSQRPGGCGAGGIFPGARADR